MIIPSPDFLGKTIYRIHSYETTRSVPDPTPPPCDKCGRGPRIRYHSEVPHLVTTIYEHKVLGYGDNLLFVENTYTDMDGDQVREIDDLGPDDLEQFLPTLEEAQQKLAQIRKRWEEENGKV